MNVLSRPVMCADGSIQFVRPHQAGGNVEQVCSRQQVKLLDALFKVPGGLPREALHAALWDIPFVRRERSVPLTSTQRASLSRSLRRLIALDLVQQPHSGFIRLTDEGRQLAELLFNQMKYWKLAELGKTLTTRKQTVGG